MASVFAVGIPCSAQLGVNITTHFLALVLVATLKLVACSLTTKRLDFINFRNFHEPFLLGTRVVNSITWIVSLFFATFAFLVDFNLAWWAISSMALFLTLVNSTRKEPLAFGIASGDRVQTSMALASIQKRFYGLVARGAVFNTLGVIRARATLTRVARSFTGVVAAIKGLPTDFVARVLRGATNSFYRIFATEACYNLLLSTGCT